MQDRTRKRKGTEVCLTFKMTKKIRKVVKGFTAAGIGIGVGATMVEKAGASPAAFTTMSGYMPVMGSVAGAGLVLDQTKKLGKVIKRKK